MAENASMGRNNTMTMVRSVLDTDDLESEAPLIVPGQPPPHWPKSGSISFDKVMMR